MIQILVDFQAFEFEILRFEDETKHNKIWDVSKFRIKKLQPGVYACSGQLELLQTLGKKSQVQLEPNAKNRLKNQIKFFNDRSRSNFSTARMVEVR